MINLNRIFKEQDYLNKETAKKHPEYGMMTREELTRNYIFAALSELGECSNEWAGFKIWKSTREENRDAPCKKCKGVGELEGEECPYCENGRTNPLREEFIDVLHFVVSVAIGFDMDPSEYMSESAQRVKGEPAFQTNTYNCILRLYETLTTAELLIQLKEMGRYMELERKLNTMKMIDYIVALGYSLGFDDFEIEEAYFSKHKINQVRQSNDY